MPGFCHNVPRTPDMHEGQPCRFLISRPLAISRSVYIGCRCRRLCFGLALVRNADGDWPSAWNGFFGSFVTTKREPNDVDVFMIMDDEFDVAALPRESRLLFDHGAAQTHFGCSVFWLRRLAAFGGEQATIEYWQVKRDGTKRGLIEIGAD